LYCITADTGVQCSTDQMGIHAKCLTGCNYAIAPDDARSPHSPSALFAIPEYLWEPTNGACRSLRLTARLLAENGWKVTLLSPAWTARPTVPRPTDVITRPSKTRHRSGVTFSQWEETGMTSLLLSSSDRFPQRPPAKLINRFYESATGLLNEEPPDVFVNRGALPQDRALRARASDAGAKVVLPLRMTGPPYDRPEAFGVVDAILCPSQYVRDHYHAHFGLEGVGIRSLLDLPSLEIPAYTPRFVTFVNPVPTKGLGLFLRVASDLLETNPEIQFLVIESRGTTDDIFDYAERNCIDLTRLTNVKINPAVPSPSAFLQYTRILMVPSLCEAYGRVAAEASHCGIPVLASAHGGLPEAVGENGTILPLPASYRKNPLVAPSTHDALPWSEAVRTLWSSSTDTKAANRCAMDRHTHDRAAHLRLFQELLSPARPSATTAPPQWATHIVR